MFANCAYTLCGCVGHKSPFSETSPVRSGQWKSSHREPSDPFSVREGHARMPTQYTHVHKRTDPNRRTYKLSCLHTHTTRNHTHPHIPPNPHTTLRPTPHTRTTNSPSPQHTHKHPTERPPLPLPLLSRVGRPEAL